MNKGTAHAIKVNTPVSSLKRPQWLVSQAGINYGEREINSGKQRDCFPLKTGRGSVRIREGQKFPVIFLSAFNYRVVTCFFHKQRN